MQRRYFIFLMAALSLTACDTYSGPVRIINLGLHPDSSTGAIMVGAHDNLWDIAKRYRLPIREIIDINGLEPPYKLSEGRRLKMPAPVDYRARSGDTLNTVASMFGVSAAQLVAVNAIPAPYRLRPGQDLRIPAAYRQQGTSPSPVILTERISTTRDPGHVGQGRSHAAPLHRDDKRESIARQQPVNMQSPSSFLWPVHGRVISGYGPKDDGLYNEGINIAAPRGTPVAAAADGVVAYVGNDLKSYGNLVLIRHGGGTMTAYAHLASMSARKGAVVRRGQVIGTVGATGAVPASQLHFEIRHGSKTTDPQPYLG